MIHGGVDGFSRSVVLTITDLKQFWTVLFKAVQTYGLPSRVRSDRGRENVGISLFMLNHSQQGPGRGSMLVGRSMHNQHQTTMTCFCTLSSLTFLPLNNIYMFWLHFVYLPRINVHLQQWVTAWIHHPLYTARNHTPMQLWTEGMLTNSMMPSGRWRLSGVTLHVDFVCAFMILKKCIMF